MGERLRVLIAGTSDEEACLLSGELARGGWNVESRRVGSPQEIDEALQDGPWQLLLARPDVPGLTPRDILAKTRGREPEIPLVVVGERDAEDTAARALRAGARDYVPREALHRLIPAVERELAHADDHAARLKAEDFKRLFEAVLETIPLGVTITDTRGKILWANPAEAQTHGYPVEELIGKDVRIFSPNRLWRPMSASQVREMKRWRRESVNVSADGHLLPVLLTSNAVRDAAGKPIAVVTVSEEISGQKEMEEALRRSEERYDVAARVVSDGLWDWNLTTNEVTYSPRWKELLGYGVEEIGNASDEWLSRVHPEDLPHLKREIADHVAGLSPILESEHRMAHQDGRYLWFACRGLVVRDTTGVARRLSGSMADVTARRMAEERLQRDAFYDALTDLPNRALLTDRLGRAVNRARRRAGYRFAVLLLDLDRFKNVIDSLGHSVGDELLVAMARRLEHSVRPGDTLARLGGDEFAMLLDDINGVSDAVHVAERIQRELSHAFLAQGQEVFLSASVGIALSGPEYERPEEILRDADTAMYRAKARGKARHELFDRSMHTRAVTLLQLETDLRKALDRGELRIEYQPIVALRSGRITGFEALVRWAHPSRGMVLPQDFIPLAEETGLIVPIGAWVLREACRQVRGMYTAGKEPLSVSVNLSAKQFTQRDLIDQIRRTLEEEKLDGNRLKLEITESVIMENSEAATAMLVQLRALHVHLHIDDFGTGYSSLSYLHRFPIDSLKIDKSFVSRMSQDENAEIVRTIVTLAHSLDMEVLAEGVETPQQLAELRALHCDSGQGHLFSKPLCAEGIQSLVASQPCW